MRLAAATFLLLALVSATGAVASTPPGTRLTVTLLRDGRDPATRIRWTLTCAPPGGTHPRPSAACSVLRRLGRTVFAPVPRDSACTEIYGGLQVAVVSGRLDGRAVWARFRRDDGCQIDRWTRAGALLPSTPGAR